MDLSDTALPVYGLDITSSPNRRKPITVARGRLDEGVLVVHDVDELRSLGELEDFLGGLDTGEASISGFDFPFGQPRRLIENLDWPRDWSEVVRRFGAMTRPEFVAFLKKYRTPRPPGDKQHRRRTDTATGGCSPMMLYGVPVGRMYHAVAPLLEATKLRVIPCRATDFPAIAIETYPALLAKHFSGGDPYKTENRRLWNCPERRAARERIVAGLRGPSLTDLTTFRLQLPDDALGAIEDASGDRLDALSCAVAAAWSWTRRDLDWGLPPDTDPVEGAIIDPTLFAS